MKKTAIAIILASVSALSVQAKTDLNSLHDELEIMSNILQTALRQENRNSAIRFRNIDVTYLANQGVVFEVSTTGSGSSFSFDFGEMSEFMHVSPSVPVAPVPPVIAGSDSWDIEIDGEEWEMIAHEAMDRAQEAMEEVRDKMRDLREQERDYGWEQREYERKRRDLEFEMRNADENRRKELTKRKQELDEELKTIEAKQAEVAKYAQQLEAEQKKQAAEQAAARQKQYTAFVSSFESNITNVLCKYGAGMKALPASENISFILPNLGTINSRDKKDKIYVFSQQDVQSCVKDKMDNKTLLEKSERYMF